MSWRSRLKLLPVLAIVAAGGIWSYQYWEAHRDELPGLDVDDVSGNRVAGTVDVVRGNAFGASAQGVEFAPLKHPSTFILGSVFRLNGGSFVQLKTNGNYLVGLDGDGEFVAEKARLSHDRTKHTLHWFVRKGTLRVKPNKYDPAEQHVEIRTAIARVRGNKAELGVRVNEAGGGQVWLMSGTAEVIWNDGRRKELKVRGMDYL
jgi:hypothetical protein